MIKEKIELFISICEALDIPTQRWHGFEGVGADGVDIECKNGKVLFMVTFKKQHKKITLEALKEGKSILIKTYKPKKLTPFKVASFIVKSHKK